jgi:hypothetical protein
MVTCSSNHNRPKRVAREPKSSRVLPWKKILLKVSEPVNKMASVMQRIRKTKLLILLKMFRRKLRKETHLQMDKIVIENQACLEIHKIKIRNPTRMMIRKLILRQKIKKRELRKTRDSEKLKS